MILLLANIGPKLSLKDCQHRSADGAHRGVLRVGPADGRSPNPEHPRGPPVHILPRQVHRRLYRRRGQGLRYSPCKYFHLGCVSGKLLIQDNPIQQVE